MIKRHAVVWPLFLLLILLMLPAAPAQQSPDAIKVDAHLVEVYATVYDRKGHYVDGLGRESFQVSDDGELEEIASFETTAQNLSCAILIDTTASMAKVLPRVKNSIVKLIDALGPQDSVAIYTFDERLVVRQNFTTDKDAAKRAVLRTHAQGQTALFDALSQVARDISKKQGKKTLIVFTDGDDNSSALGANAVVARAKKAGVPLYAVAEGEAARSANLRKLLEDLSKRTGGSTYQVNKSADMEGVFHKIAQDLQHLYMITYQPPFDSADVNWHKIDLVVKGLKDYHVRAKEGYFPD